MSVLNKKGMNKITYKGAELLTQANWNFLQALDIGYNMLGSKGAKLITKCNWPCLKELGMCRYFINKVVMKLEVTVFAIY